MLTLKKVKELVEAPVHTKRVPSPKVLLEEGLILMRKEFDHGSHLTVYQTLTPLHIWKHTGYDIFTLGFRSERFPIWLKFLHPMKCLVEQISVGHRSQIIGKHLVLLLSQLGPQHGFGISKQLL